MTDEQRSNQIPEPQGHFWGLPYDWRRPTLARWRSRWWNRSDLRLLTPKTFGWGWDINMYWVFHARQFVRARRAS